MCLLIVKPEGIALPDPYYTCRAASDANPDGFGIAWKIGDGRIAIRKGFHSHRDQARLILKIGHAAAIIHWRLGTSGGLTKANCHPFRIRDGSAFAHNGIIRIPVEKHRSDTRIVADYATNTEDLIGLLESYVGPTNKFAILSPDDDEPIILGEEYGDWSNECWYSNTYWDYWTPVKSRYWPCQDNTSKKWTWPDDYGLDRLA